jgi:hypothetical protein
MYFEATPRKFVKYCRGNSTRTARKLKKSWTIEAENDRRNSALRFRCASETRMQVTEVPIFAPMIMGMAPLTVNAPPPTMVTTIEVVAEELWITPVVTIPMKRPTRGFDVLPMSDSANPAPNIFNAETIRLMLKRKRYRNARS